jgi:hypothetical protein
VYTYAFIALADYASAGYKGTLLIYDHTSQRSTDDAERVSKTHDAGFTEE